MMDRTRLYNLAAILVLGLVYALLAPILFDLSAIPFDSDEATHALDGLEIAAAAYHGKIGALLDRFYFTHWYPPLLPAYLAPFFVVLKPSVWSARYPVLLLAIVYLALIYRVSKAVAKSPAAGLIALILTATSPIMWIHSLLCMEEMLAMIGALVVVLAFVAYRDTRPVLIGVGLAFTLLSRLSIGIYAAGAVLLCIWSGGDRVAAKFRLTLRAFAPLAITAVAWWAHPAKMADFYDYVRASPPAFSAFGWREVLHYGRAMVTTYAVNPVVGVIALAALLAAFSRWRNPGLRLCLSVVLVTWAGLLVKRLTNTRFFLSAVPIVFLVAGETILTYGAVLLRWCQARRVATLCWVLLAALGASVGVYTAARVASLPFLIEVAYETDVEAASVQAWIADTVPRDSPAFLVNAWDPFSTSALGFTIGSVQWPDWRGSHVTDVFLHDPEASPEAVAQFAEAIQSVPAGYVIHLGNTPVPNAGAWWAYEAILKPLLTEQEPVRGAFWMRAWDGNLERELLTRPLRYAVRENREAARESYRYPLLMEVQVLAFQR